MSKCITNEIECPECGHKQNFVRWQSILADIDPQLKEQVLSGELFVFHCQSCDKKFPITYPCLYHDIGKHLMVYLAPGPEAVEEMNKLLLQSPEAFEIQARQGYIYRAVSTVNEMAEKIMIHDMKLDDRVIEVIKMLILFKSGNEGLDVDSVAGMFYYPGKEGKHQISLLFGDGRQSFIPIDEDLLQETMDNLKDKIEEHTGEGYQTINVEWVAQVLA